MMKYNIVVCRYDKILINVGAYVIPSYVCVCVCVWCADQELHMRPHYQDFIITTQCCILVYHFNNS